MQAALEDEKGVRVLCTSHDDATHFRMRLNNARSVHRTQNSRVYQDPDDPRHGKSEYDKLIFRIKQVDGKFYVYMEHNPYGVHGFELLSQLEEPEGANGSVNE